MVFVEICNVCAGRAIIEAAKRIINSDKVCRSYSDLNFGVTFLEHSVVLPRNQRVANKPYHCSVSETDAAVAEKPRNAPEVAQLLFYVVFFCISYQLSKILCLN